MIVPTGELDGRQDVDTGTAVDIPIVPTGELDGRQDYGCDVPLKDKLYQLGNWMAGKTLLPLI